MSQPENAEEKKNVVEDASLVYKKHDEFFDHYYRIREELNANIAYTLIWKDYWKSVLASMMKLITWSSNYMNEPEKKRNDLFSLKDKYSSEIQKGNTEAIKNFLQELNQIWDGIDQEHEIYELLPKPDKQSTQWKQLDDYWKEEESLEMREAKRAFADLMKNHIKN